MRTLTTRALLLASAALSVAPTSTRAGASLPPVADVTGKTVTLPNGTRTTVEAALGRLQGTTIWRPVSTRATSPSWSFSQSGKLAVTSRAYEVLSTRGPVSAIRVCYANWGFVADGNGATEGEGAVDTLTVAGSVEVNATTAVTWVQGSGNVSILPAYFGASRSVVLAPGAQVCSDPIQYPFGPGQAIYVRTHRIGAGTGVAPNSRNLTNALSEGTNDAYFAGASISSTATTTTAVAGTLSGVPGVVLPLAPGTLSFSGGTITTATLDDAAGNIPAGNGIAAGSTVNYATGAITLNLATATAPNLVRVTGYGAGASAADATLTPTIANFAAVTHGIFGPAAILGQTASSSAVRPFGTLTIGDSIMYGAGNSADPGIGWAAYAAQQTGSPGVLRVPQSSELAAEWAAPAKRMRRLRLAAGNFDRVIIGYGSNDLATSRTLAQIQADYLTDVASVTPFLPNGFRDVWAATILPRTSGGLVTPAVSAAIFGPGTVGSGSPSLRNALNAWLCAQVGVTIGGVIDIAAAVENSPASCAGAGDGQWKSASYTSDFIHPTQLGNQAIANMIGPTGTAPSPAFTVP